MIESKGSEAGKCPRRFSVWQERVSGQYVKYVASLFPLCITVWIDDTVNPHAISRGNEDGKRRKEVCCEPAWLSDETQ